MGMPRNHYLEFTFVSDPLFPVITSSSNAALVLNKFFSYTITADAPTTSLDYLGLDGTLDGSLPSGLSFDPATGTISGLYLAMPHLTPWPKERAHPTNTQRAILSQNGGTGLRLSRRNRRQKFYSLR